MECDEDAVELVDAIDDGCDEDVVELEDAIDA
jgi:hypothetical protein